MLWTGVGREQEREAGQRSLEEEDAFFTPGDHGEIPGRDEKIRGFRSDAEPIGCPRRRVGDLDESHLAGRQRVVHACDDARLPNSQCDYWFALSLQYPHVQHAWEIGRRRVGKEW